uniref:Uncharacterized protein n=1 Tax=Cucumis melo TaxID=3656 RepID=A0A9I9DZP3_CUCME
MEIHRDGDDDKRLGLKDEKMQRWSKLCRQGSVGAEAVRLLQIWTSRRRGDGSNNSGLQHYRRL